MTNKIASNSMIFGSLYPQPLPLNSTAGRVAPPVLEEGDVAEVRLTSHCSSAHGLGLQSPEHRRGVTARDKMAQVAKSGLQCHLMATVAAKVDLTPSEAARLNNTVKPMQYAVLKAHIGMLEKLQENICAHAQGDDVIGALTQAQRADALNALLSISTDELDQRLAGMTALFAELQRGQEGDAASDATLKLSMPQKILLTLQALKAPAEDMLGLDSDVRETMDAVQDLPLATAYAVLMAFTALPVEYGRRLRDQVVLGLFSQATPEQATLAMQGLRRLSCDELADLAVVVDQDAPPQMLLALLSGTMPERPENLKAVRALYDNHLISDAPQSDQWAVARNCLSMTPREREYVAKCMNNLGSRQAVMSVALLPPAGRWERMDALAEALRFGLLHDVDVDGQAARVGAWLKLSNQATSTILQFMRETPMYCALGDIVSGPDPVGYVKSHAEEAKTQQACHALVDQAGAPRTHRVLANISVYLLHGTDFTPSMRATLRSEAANGRPVQSQISGAIFALRNRPCVDGRDEVLAAAWYLVDVEKDPALRRARREKVLLALLQRDPRAALVHAASYTPEEASNGSAPQAPTPDASSVMRRVFSAPAQLMNLAVAKLTRRHSVDVMNS